MLAYIFQNVPEQGKCGDINAKIKNFNVLD